MPHFRPRDLWLANSTYEGPAVDLVDPDPQCSVFQDGENHTFDLCQREAACPVYPGWPNSTTPKGCTYVDETFAVHALQTVTNHDPAQGPLFMFWAPHIVHSASLCYRSPCVPPESLAMAYATCGRTVHCFLPACSLACMSISDAIWCVPWLISYLPQPLQVPQQYYDKFGFIDDWRRRRYHAMVNFMDAKVGELVEALKAPALGAEAGMYENTIIFFSADSEWQSLRSHTLLFWM
eukprot:SAG31_NODE_4869_length_2877_cov_1.648446_6_plen_236_part_00